MQYWFSFTPNPADSAGLAPTFLDFIKFDGTTLTPPGVTQLIAGTGIYQFNYTPSFSIAFRIYGNTTGLATSFRYVTGNVETNDTVSDQVTVVGTNVLTTLALGGSIYSKENNTGTTLVAIGNTVAAIVGPSFSIAVSGIGSTASPYGGISLEPVDLFGYLKWAKEFLSGAQSFNKLTGAWSIYDRNFATLLAFKSVTNSVNGVTRG